MNVISTVLKGFSQVFFQENIIAGLLIMIGIGVASPTALLFSLVGNISSILTMGLLKIDGQFLPSGLYAFNGVLIGTAVSFYIKNLPTAFTATIVASIVATLIFYVLFKNQISPLAAPFVLVMWAVILLLKYLKTN